MRAIDADKLFAAFENAAWFDNADRDIAEDLLLDAPVVNQTEQPDPDTGLVPCGCGGKAETHELFGEYSGTYMTDCKECGTGTTQYSTKKESRDAWNTAMGWRASE